MTENEKKRKDRFIEELLKAETTKEDIDRSRNLLQREKSSYLKGVIDFVKWTSTIAVAAAIWVLNVVTSLSGITQRIGILAFGSLVISLFFAILTVREAVKNWGRNWTIAEKAFNVNILSFERQRIPDLVREEDLIQAHHDFWSTARDFHETPEKTNKWVKWHLVFLFVGLVFYGISEFASIISSN